MNPIERVGSTFNDKNYRGQVRNMADTLVLASFIKIMQDGFSTKTSQETAASFLLESITKQKAVNCKTDLSSKKISNIVKRKDPVPDDIREASSIPEVIKGVREYFKALVMSELNPDCKLEILERVHLLVSKDEDILPLMKSVDK
jgi:hypothetical protein